MIISCNLFFTYDNYMSSSLYRTINYHSFLPQCMLHAESTDRELSFAYKISLQTLSGERPFRPVYLLKTKNIPGFRILVNFQRFLRIVVQKFSHHDPWFTSKNNI